MASMLPTRSPSRSTIVLPCQLRTVSTSTISCSFARSRVLLSMLPAGRWAPRARTPRRHRARSAVPPDAAPGCLHLVEAAGPRGALRTGVDAGGVVVVAAWSGRLLHLLPKFGAALLGPAGRTLPVALHGPDATAADGHDHRADHGGQDRVPEAGHDPGGDLQLVQGGEGGEHQDRDPCPASDQLAALHGPEHVGQQVGDRPGDGGGDHDDQDGHEHVRQVGDQAAKQVRDGVDPNTPKANWSTNSMMVQNTSLARMSEGSYLLLASTRRTPP